MLYLKISILVLASVLLLFSSCNKDDDSSETEAIITESLFNSSSLVSFTTVEATLEDGTTADCFQITFSANPVANGPFCPETINDVGGMAFYDGATDPGLKVLSAGLLNAIESDGYDMVNANGTVNIDDFSGTVMTDTSKSYCLDAAPDDNLQLTFLIPVTPKLAASNNDIDEVELIGLSLDGVPVNGDPPSAISGPAGMGGGPGGGGPGGGTGGATTSSQISMPSIDPCGGHHDPAGYYHWHFVPQVINQVLTANNITEITCTKINQTSDHALFGFAKDGFPIYAYATEPTDLDDCGGRTAATNEFPDGVYHYVASTTSAPNVPKCLKGVAANDAFSYN